MGGVRVDTANGPVFRKTAPVAERAMLEAEADGLAELAAANVIRVPAVVGIDADDEFCRLDIEWLDLAAADENAVLGRRLARLHRVAADRHGWHRDNTIGPTPQRNPRADDWVAFFREHRLEYQLELAANNGYGGELQVLGRQLVERIEALFEGYAPVPSLLHGDLWAGNRGTVDDEPVIFDPAVYYGDRETDLAMTRLFGGFGDAFYAAYAAEWPLARGHGARNDLYQLYHVLNHLNLFGRSYLAQSVHLLRECLSHAARKW